MMSSNNIPGKEDAVAGDILCAKEDGSKIVVKAVDWSSIPSSWTPIAVVVIPPSHDVYGTGEGAAVSLIYLSCRTNNEESASKLVCWGQYNRDTSLTNFNRINATNNASNPTISVASKAFLPSDNYTSIQCKTDPLAYYNKSPYAPSPYLSDGSRNEIYYTTEYSEYNALSDFDGIGNTDLLCSLATAQSDWRTASIITNNYNSGYSPAACCCWRYHPVGTNQGDWYLPAVGELGYLIVRLKTINNSISNVGGKTITDTSHIFPSSEYSNTIVYRVSISDGYVEEYNKDSYNYVRSFIRF